MMIPAEPEATDNIVNHPRRDAYEALKVTNSNAGEAFSKPAASPDGLDDMDEKDVQRLEDRIDAVDREGQLRLDIVMARVEGKLEGIAGALGEVKTQNRETRSLIIASSLAIFFGVIASMFALKQVWIGGVQVGQTASQPTSSAPAPSR